MGITDLEKYKVILLIAGQRSGTNYYRSMLASTGLFLDCNEVCLGEYADDRITKGIYFEQFNFWRFKTEKLKQDMYLHLPSGENQRQLIRAYFKFLSENLNQEQKYAVVDIKYNYASVFNTYNHNQSIPPFLISRLCNELAVTVIHLKRVDVFSATVSEFVANMTKRFGIPKDKEIALPTISIDTDKFKEFLIYKHNQNQQFNEWINRYISNNLIEFIYEEIDTDEKFIKNVKPVLERKLNLNLPSHFEAWCKKIITDVESVVENIEELRLIASSVGIPNDLEFKRNYKS